MNDKTQIGCAVPLELAAQIKAAAAKQELSVSQWVRDALEARLATPRATTVMEIPMVPMPGPVKTLLESTHLAWW